MTSLKIPAETAGNREGFRIKYFKMKNTEYIIILIVLTIIGGCNKKEPRRLNPEKPNIVIVLTDDQGIGDIGYNGNPYIKTPTLDKLASQSTRLTSFYVSPVCAPTRACLMTGKFYERTGVYDTYNGGATMAAEEITMAEIFSENNYITGIFGKWHLGDNYPYRPIDQGFDESLIHKAGGMGQPGDFVNFRAGDSAYFNPVLYKNEELIKTSGYCTDVFTNGAIDFIKENKDSPFLLYVSYNAPHTPLQLPGEYYDLYKDISFDINSFATIDSAVENMSRRDVESARRVYGMVTNIDDNISRILKTLEEEGLSDNTIFVFFTDNGPQQNRYRMGLRGRKGTVYEGGIKVPCMIYYPSVFEEGAQIETPLAHIDLLPTLMDLCRINSPAISQMNGKSFVPVLEGKDSYFYSRPVFGEWVRGFPVKYRNTWAMQGDFKLVGNTGYDAAIQDFELFNISDDSEEKENLISSKKDVAAELKQKLNNWYDKNYRGKNYQDVHPVFVGTKHENPVFLNRNDAKGEPIWTEEEIYAYWDIKVVEEGTYHISAEFIKEIETPGNLMVKMYPLQFQKAYNEAPLLNAEIDNINLSKGDYKLEVYFETTRGKRIFPLVVSLNRKDI